MHSPGDDRREDAQDRIVPSESESTAKRDAGDRAARPRPRPSIPSRKLTMFITATIQSIVSGIHRRRQIDRAEKRNVKWSIQTPKKGGIAAATSWPASLRPGASSRKSSIAPTTVATAAPSSTLAVSPAELEERASAGTKIPKKRAEPAETAGSG